MTLEPRSWHVGGSLRVSTGNTGSPFSRLDVELVAEVRPPSGTPRSRPEVQGQKHNGAKCCPVGTGPESPGQSQGHAEERQLGAAATWTAGDVSIAVRAQGQDPGAAADGFAPPAPFKAQLKTSVLKEDIFQCQISKN